MPEKGSEETFVEIKGRYTGYASIPNPLNFDLKYPSIDTDEITFISRSQAIPPIATVNVNQTITQNGLSITLDRVEIASTETRLYIKASNASSNLATLSYWNAALIQGQQQVHINLTPGPFSPNMDGSLINGTSTEGAMIFNALDLNTHKATLHWSDPRTDDGSAKFTDWIWDFSW